MYSASDANPQNLHIPELRGVHYIEESNRTRQNRFPEVNTPQTSNQFDSARNYIFKVSVDRSV